MISKSYLLKNRRQEINKKRTKRKKRVVKLLLISSMLIIILVAIRSNIKEITENCIRFCYNSKFLQIKDIELKGNRRIGLEEIKTWAGLKEGINILHLDLDRITGLAEAHPWIRSLEVERRFPCSLSIQIEESIPVAIWEDGRKRFLMDEFGILLGELNEDSGLPVLIGTKKGVSEIGGRCPSVCWSSALCAIERIRQDYPGLLTDIKKFYILSEYQIIIYLNDNKKILLNMENIDNRIYILRLLIEKDPGLWHSMSYCDLRFKDKIIFG